MVERTELAGNGSLAVIHTLDWSPFLSPGLAAKHEISALEVNACVYLFEEGERTASAELFIYFTTPAALHSEWIDYLSPPIDPDLTPLFSLEEWEAIQQEPRGTYWVDQGDPGERVFGLFADEEDQLDYEPLRLLVNVEHLDAALIHRATRDAIARFYPDIFRRMDVVWEQDYPHELLEALVWHHELRQSVERAADRPSFLRRSALADAYWMETLLPLVHDAKDSRVITEPEYVKFMEEDEAQSSDMRLFQESGSSSTWRDHLLQAEEVKEGVDYEMLYAEIQKLTEWEKRHPELPVRMALEWLETRRGPRF